ncbi:MAG: recombinase family protein, partial [Ktedonobacterales bacterium]
IWDLLQNPAYKGEAAFGRTRSGPLEPRWRDPRGRPAQSRRGSAPKAAPSTAWITLPVPALVDTAVFDAAQVQLQENRARARIPLKGNRYLLQGVIVCAHCVAFVDIPCRPDVTRQHSLQGERAIHPLAQAEGLSGPFL